MQYRRDYTAGATYFFTVVTFRRSRLFDQPENIEAIVMLPNHIHAIWTLPSGDADYSIRWRNIKRSFTASVADEKRPSVFAARRHKNAAKIVKAAQKASDRIQRDLLLKAGT